MPRHLAAKNPSAPRDLLPALENLSRHMQQAYPDPATTRSEAARAAQAFKTWLDHFRAGPSPQHGEETRNLLLEQSSQFSSWDSAEQLYLALVALNETHPEPAALKILDDMGRLLAFPREYASPKEFCSVQSELAKRVEMLRRLRRR